MSTNGTRLARGQGWVLGLTSAASLMVSLDSQVVATALPAIRLTGTRRWPPWSGR